MQISQVLECFPDARKQGSGWSCRCPAHDDQHPSLSISVKEGHILIHCHAGCSVADILRKVNLSMKDLMPEAVPTSSLGVVVGSYEYRNESGKILYRVVRYSPKNFRQQASDGRGGWINSMNQVERVPYHLPILLKAPAEMPIYIVEGEKDVDRLRTLGYLATTNAGGAGKFRTIRTEIIEKVFRDRRVILLPDNDEPGRLHAEDVARCLQKIAASIRIVHLPELPPKGDVSDWLNAGHTAEELERVLEQAMLEPLWQPSPATQKSFGGLALTSMASVTPHALEWLIPDVLPKGKLVVLAGDGGNGKSCITLDLAACLSMGRPAMGLDYVPGPPSEVLLISCEDDAADTVVPRLLAAQGDCSKIFRVDGIRDEEGKPRPFCLSDVDAVRIELQRRPSISLVIIDPIGAYVARSGINDHKDSELRMILDPLSELAAETGVTFLLVKHLNKSSGGRAVQRISGSMAITNAVRLAWLVAPHPEDPTTRVMARVKSNIVSDTSARGFAYKMQSLEPAEANRALTSFAGLEPMDRDRLAAQMFRIAWLGTSQIDADTLLKPGDHEEKSDQKDALKWLLEFLEEGPRPSAEIMETAEAEGYSRTSVYQAKKKSGEIRVKKRGQGEQVQWWWGIGEPKEWLIPETPTIALKRQFPQKIPEFMEGIEDLEPLF